MSTVRPVHDVRSRNVITIHSTDRHNHGCCTYTSNELGYGQSRRSFTAVQKQYLCIYCEDEEITDDRKKALKILRGIGDEGTRRLQVSGLSEEDKRKPDKL